MSIFRSLLRSLFPSNPSTRPRRTALSVSDVHLVGEGCVFEGQSLTVAGSVRIDGCVRADVTALGRVVIGSSGMVEGRIEADHVVCAGRLIGDVVARKLYLLSTAHFDGESVTERVFVAEGVQGTASLRTDAADPALEALSTPPDGMARPVLGPPPTRPTPPLASPAGGGLLAAQGDGAVAHDGRDGYEPVAPDSGSAESESATGDGPLPGSRLW